MDRRNFVIRMIGLPLVATTSIRLLAAEECADSKAEPKPGVSSFGYYQGLSPDETRDAARDDGTDWKMPCVLNSDIQTGTAKTYTFWHGHDGHDHMFTISEIEFQRLKDGHNIEIYTSVIDDHRHALKIDLAKACTVA